MNFDITVFGVSLGVAIGAIFKWSADYLIKDKELTNEYHKLIIGKRIVAYEKVEAVIKMLKFSRKDFDNRNYYDFFNSLKTYEGFVSILASSLQETMWIDAKTVKDLQKLVFILNNGTPLLSERVVKEQGKLMYQELSETREKLEDNVTFDMKNLHKVGKFLKQDRSLLRGFVKPDDPDWLPDFKSRLKRAERK